MTKIRRIPPTPSTDPIIALLTSSLLLSEFEFPFGEEGNDLCGGEFPDPPEDGGGWPVTGAGG